MTADEKSRVEISAKHEALEEILAWLSDKPETRRILLIAAWQAGIITGFGVAQYINNDPDLGGL